MDSDATLQLVRDWITLGSYDTWARELRSSFTRSWHQTIANEIAYLDVDLTCSTVMVPFHVPLLLKNVLSDGAVIAGVAAPHHGVVQCRPEPAPVQQLRRSSSRRGVRRGSVHHQELLNMPPPVCSLLVFSLGAAAVAAWTFWGDMKLVWGHKVGQFYNL